MRPSCTPRRSAGTPSRSATLLAKRGVTPPVFVGNGAKTQAQAEMWFGAARGARHAVVALVGSGVGAAVITDGAPYQGVSSSAGEWGHTLLDRTAGAPAGAAPAAAWRPMSAPKASSTATRRPAAPRRRRPGRTRCRCPGHRPGRRHWDDRRDGGDRRTHRRRGSRETRLGRVGAAGGDRRPTSVPASATWSTCSTRSGSCSAAGPAWRSAPSWLPQIRAAAEERALVPPVRAGDDRAECAGRRRGRAGRGHVAVGGVPGPGR